MKALTKTQRRKKVLGVLSTLYSVLIYTVSTISGTIIGT